MFHMNFKVIYFFIYLLASYPFNLERKNTFIYSRWNRMIKPVGGQKKKKRSLMVILKFSDKTRSRFFEPLDFTIHFNRTWKLAIRILKISLLNLDLLTKNRFSAAILNFYDQTGSSFLNKPFFLITTIEPENLPLEFWKYLN